MKKPLLAVVAILLFSLIVWKGSSFMRDAQGNFRMFNTGVQQELKASSDFTLTGLEKSYSAEKPILFDLHMSAPHFEDEQVSSTFARISLRKSGETKAFSSMPMAYDKSARSWNMKWYEMLQEGNYEMVFQYNGTPAVEKIFPFSVTR